MPRLTYRWPLVALLAVSSLAPRAQLLEGGARHIALARADVAAGADAWAEANPAALATLDGRRLELFGAQAFGLPDLRLAAAAGVVAGRAGGAALTVRAHGAADYRENRVTAAVARTFPLAPGRRVAVGVRVAAHLTSITGFRPPATIDAGAGLLADVSQRLRLGLAADNLAGLARPDSSDLRRPLAASPVMRAGLALQPASGARFMLGVDKDLQFAAVVRVGAEFAPHPALVLRLGAASAAAGNPARICFGAAVSAGRVGIDLAAEWHEVLGLSPAVGAAVRF